jgi:1-acyl-sn-glycerol-3-phosphate acyltransferase
MSKGILRAAGRAIAFLLLTAGLLPLHVVALALPSGNARRLRRFWCRGTCRILGVRLHREGRPFRGCPTLFVANHVSYLDIPAIGAFVDGTFIAKAEVSTWPLFGPLSRLAGTFFVKRHWRQALIQRNALAARLRQNESFILFGEGTSTNGLSVRPFKTSLLSVAEPWILDCPVAVQAVTLAFVRLADGTPITAKDCDLYAWHGDMALLPHLWNVLKLDGVELRVVLHEPVLSWSVQSRKVLGRALRQEIALTLARCRDLPAATGIADVPTAAMIAEAF